MANAFLIVGVGGCGRGVCNHIKYELEQSYGSLEKAKTKVLVIDGPDSPSQYALPGDFDIGPMPGSTEFLRTAEAANPANVIRNIASDSIGPNEQYIAEWLSKEDARNIPTTTINPVAGFGGHRSPGHAYFYLDIDRINKMIKDSYQSVRTLLDKDGQVHVCLVASQSGGTGAGMLWDIAHLIRGIVAQNKDSMFCFLPLANTYHAIFSGSEKEKKDSDAKNFAGFLNLMRFMEANVGYAVTIKYSDSITAYNPQLIDIPFILDGNVISSKISDVKPQLGVVPAISDFICSIIKDNTSANQIGEDLTNWINKMIGVAASQEKYGSFGTFSIKYFHKEVLSSFCYKFAYEIYNDILSPLADAVQQGKTLAAQSLNETVFTQMIENFCTIKLEPNQWRNLHSQIRVGRIGDSPAPSLEPLENVIGVSGLLFKKNDEEVVREAEQFSNNMKTQFGKWINRQHKRIVEAFIQGGNDIKGVEYTIHNIFSKIEVDKENKTSVTPKTLRESPSSIVIARDFLKFLLDKLESGRNEQGGIHREGFVDFISREFNRYYYPAGHGNPDIIATHINVVSNKRISMANKNKEKQLDYLRAATKLLELEVWQIIVKGVQTIADDIRLGVIKLWNLVGDDANGWVHILKAAMEDMEKKYDTDITRRRKFLEMRLRAYLPDPGEGAEEKLFEELAEPEIVELKSHITWNFAIDPAKPDRYSILLTSQKVENFDYGRFESFYKDPGTGIPMETYKYSPFEHVQYARNVLEEKLNKKTIWDIMELDYEHEWRREEEHKDKKKEDYANEWIDKLLSCSETLLHAAGQPQHKKSFIFYDSRETSESTSIASLFSQEIKNRRTTEETVVTHNFFSKEIRRAVAYLRIPAKNWGYYNSAFANYLDYRKEPSNVLIDIYPNEQIGWTLSQYIRENIGRDFQLFDSKITSLFNNREVFKSMVLCYLLQLIPLKPGATATDLAQYKLDLRAGEIILSSVDNVRTLAQMVNRLGYIDSGTFRENSDIHNAMKELWLKKENQALKDGKLKELLEEITQKYDSFDFPPSTQDADFPYDQLKLAFKAVIHEYKAKLAERVKNVLVSL
jgi:hypothetical protein